MWELLPNIIKFEYILSQWSIDVSLLKIQWWL